MLFIRNKTNIRKKSELIFSKFKIGNWEQGWSQVTFLNMEAHANQVLDKGGIADVIRHFATVS